jgi:predicted transposase/invertase (TIGR01784 family)
MIMPIAALNNQVIFKKLLSDEDILKAFIKDFLDIDLQPETIEVEKKFVPPIGGVDIEIDIFVNDPIHRLVIEIQRERYDYDFDRFWHYHLVSQVELVKSHKSYKLEPTVYTIVWFTRKIREKHYQRSLITTRQVSETEKGENLGLYPHKLFFLNPFYLNEQTPKGLKDWMELVTESITHPQNPNINLSRPIIQKAAKLIDDDGLTAQERLSIMDERDYDNLRRREQEEGRFAEKRETARKMLADGLEPVIIMKYTGLSPEELATLSSTQ